MRIPADLKDRLDAAAEESRRSMTAEVVARLQESFETKAGVTPDSLAQELAFIRHLHERQSTALEFGQNVLAQFLLVAEPALPNELASEPYMAAAIRLAKGIRNKDSAEIAAAFTVFFPELKGNPVVAELQEVAAKQARGEDVRPFIRSHTEESRASWEAKQLRPQGVISHYEELLPRPKPEAPAGLARPDNQPKGPRPSSNARRPAAKKTGK